MAILFNLANAEEDIKFRLKLDRQGGTNKELMSNEICFGHRLRKDHVGKSLTN